MQKRYAQLADRPDEPSSAEQQSADVAAPGPAEFVSYTTSKAFHYSRRWEYRRVDRTGSAQLLTEDQLNSLGAEGWELSGVVSDFAGTHYFMKRRRGSTSEG